MAGLEVACGWCPMCDAALVARHAGLWCPLCRMKVEGCCEGARQ